MKALKNTLLVSINPNEKSEVFIGGSAMLSGKQYSDNFREKTPVVAKVLQNSTPFKEGQYIITNYTHFDIESPYLVEDNIYAIPNDELILAIIDDEGDLIPVNGNIICENVKIKTSLELPEDLIKEHDDRGNVIRGTSGYKKGDFIFWLPFSNYEIVYTWKGIEKRAIKVYKDEVVGIYKQ